MTGIATEGTQHPHQVYDCKAIEKHLHELLLVGRHKPSTQDQQSSENAELSSPSTSSEPGLTNHHGENCCRSLLLLLAKIVKRGRVFLGCKQVISFWGTETDQKELFFLLHMDRSE